MNYFGHFLVPVKLNEHISIPGSGGSFGSSGGSYGGGGGSCGKISLIKIFFYNVT